MDMMLLVDVYLEFSFPYEMALAMLKALKRGGELVLEDFRTEEENVPIKNYPQDESATGGKRV